MLLKYNMKKALLLLFIVSNTFAQTNVFDSFDVFFQNNVSKDGSVNYSRIKKVQKELKSLLNEINSQEIYSWDKNTKMAFWINTYNVFCINFIIQNYPVNSIKDIRNPWTSKTNYFENKTVSLNHIEHNILRKMGDPKIHFAIVCASESCPKLSNKAYKPNILKEQLNESAKDFVNDNSKNSISINNIEISNIFKWFKKDFTTEKSIIEYINQFSNIEIQPKAKISYKTYNWNLNE
jgi:hypothetical protein